MQLFIDCETTGLSAIKNDLITVTLGSKLHGYNTFFMKPEGEIEERALEVNGFTRSEIEAFPNKNIAREDFLAVLEECNTKITPIGHNYQFDMQFLIKFLGEENYNKFFDRRYLDTMIIAKFYDELFNVGIESFSLIGLCEKFDLVHLNAHSSYGDVMATERLYYKLKELFKNVCTGN